jgi:hypothetical protein
VFQVVHLVGGEGMALCDLGHGRHVCRGRLLGLANLLDRDLLYRDGLVRLVDPACPYLEGPYILFPCRGRKPLEGLAGRGALYREDLCSLTCDHSSRRIADLVLGTLDPVPCHARGRDHNPCLWYPDLCLREVQKDIWHLVPDLLRLLLLGLAKILSRPTLVFRALLELA